MSELYPDYFARFYDLIYNQVRDGVDNNFYLDRIRETKGKVLEAGVGTGRLFMQALNNGADIYGIDISPAMLDVLNSKLNPEQQKRVSLQNITDFRSGHKFDLIIAPFRVFMHVTGKHEHMETLDNVYNNLNPGGQFIFDLFIPDLKALITGLENVTDFEGEYEPGYRMKRIVSTRPDRLNQIINVDFRIEWNDSESSHSEKWRSQMRYLFRFELEHLIERSKFSSYKILGDFYGNELNDNSKEFILVCKK
jgi:SAM-dependent methyltransferase